METWTIKINRNSSVETQASYPIRKPARILGMYYLNLLAFNLV